MAWLSRHLSTAASRSSQIRLALSGAMDFTRLRVRESPFRNFNSRFNLAGKLIDALRSNNHWRAASGRSRRGGASIHRCRRELEMDGATSGVERDGLEYVQHVHPQQQGGMIRDAPVVEGVNRTEHDGKIGQADRAQGQAFQGGQPAREALTGQADQLQVRPVA